MKNAKPFFKMLIGLQILEEKFLKIHDQNKKGRPTYGLQ